MRGRRRDSRSGAYRARRRARAGLLGLALPFLALTSCSEDAASPAALSVTPTHIQLTPADSVVTLEIGNAGSGSLTWNLSHDAPWLDPRAAGGTTAGSSPVRLTIVRDSLDQTPRVATVTVASDGGRGSLQVAMWTALESEPRQLDLADTAEGRLLIRNLGHEPLSWQVTPAVGWLTASPRSGRLDGKPGADTVRVTVLPGALAPGDHAGQLIVSAGALGCDSIAVTVRVPHVSGHLYFAGTRIPVADAVVAIGAIRDTTDATGAYALANVPIGTHTIAATRSGFDPVTAELTVSESGAIWDACLTSEIHAHTISGTVRNSLGNGTRTTVGTLLNPDGSESDLTTMTAENGEYRLPAIPEGARTIRWDNYYYEVRDELIDVAEASTTHDVELVALPVAPPVRYDNENHVHLDRVGCDRVRVTWKLRFEETVAGYRVERSTSADGPFSEINGLVDGDLNQYLDSVPGFGQYVYRVRTENIDGVVGAPTNPEHDRINLEIWANLNDGTVYGDSLHRYGQVTLHDPYFNRMIMFAGVGCEGGHCGDDFNDTWQLDLDDYTWHLLDPGTGPGKRQSHVAIYDEARQRMVVFGGVNLTQGTFYRDTWAYDLSTASGGSWTLLNDGDTGPAQRFDHVGIYTGPGDDRFLVHGGKGRSGEVFNDVWAFDLATHSWQRILEGYYGEQDPQPLGRYGHSGAYDPLRHRFVFHGGQRSSSVLYEDTWALDLATDSWTPLSSGPGLRYGHAAAYDPIGDRMIVYGGRAQGDVVYDDLQALVFGTTAYWQELSQEDAAGPGLRYHHSLVYDTVGDRILVFAGIKPRSDPELRPDTWAFCIQR